MPDGGSRWRVVVRESRSCLTIVIGMKMSPAIRRAHKVMLSAVKLEAALT